MIRQLAVRVRARLSYANVVSTLALFIAVGGGAAFAATTLPHGSVGSAQLRSNAVTSSKIKSSAVGTSEIKNRSIALTDLSLAARTSLRGAQGPTGPAGPTGAAAVTDRAAINAGGGQAYGNSRGATYTGGNEYTVEFTHDVSACVYSATLAAVPNGATVDQPPAGGRITVASAGGVNVLVRTYAADGTPVASPFDVIVAC